MAICKKASIIYINFLLVLFPGCFSLQSDVPNTAEKEISNKNNNELEEQEVNIDYALLSKEIDSLYIMISDNSNKISSLKDSIKVFQQLDFSIETSEDDIINSLIRIQSKLNIIEEKLFIYDSLYFNTLNELIRLEEKINSSASIDDTNDIDYKPQNNSEYDFDSKYKEGYALYLEQEYDDAISIFREIISMDPSYVNADNSQFWIGQIYFLRKEYEFAIIEYKKVLNLGDNNKVSDADYKIALSYKSLGNILEAKKMFNQIIKKYPENENLIIKVKKEINNIN